MAARGQGDQARVVPGHGEQRGRVQPPRGGQHLGDHLRRLPVAAQPGQQVRPRGEAGKRHDRDVAGRRDAPLDGAQRALVVAAQVSAHVVWIQRT